MVGPLQHVDSEALGALHQRIQDPEESTCLSSQRASSHRVSDSICDGSDSVDNLQHVERQSPKHSLCIRFPLCIAKHLWTASAKAPKVQSVVLKFRMSIGNLGVGSDLGLPLTWRLERQDKEEVSLWTDASGQVFERNVLQNGVSHGCEN